jgi:hypothetical protein
LRSSDGLRRDKLNLNFRNASSRLALAARKRSIQNLKRVAARATTPFGRSPTDQWRRIPGHRLKRATKRKPALSSQGHTFISTPSPPGCTRTTSQHIAARLRTAHTRKHQRAAALPHTGRFLAHIPRASSSLSPSACQPRLWRAEHLQRALRFPGELVSIASGTAGVRHQRRHGCPL